jgi:hypothetical protein
MAKAQSLNTRTPRAYYTIRYTTMEPESLPSSANQAAADHNLRAYSVGSCYARTPNYPNGVYWMVLLFY